MSGRWLTNLVLAVVVAGLVAWLLWQPEEAEGVATPFEDLDTAAVGRIEVASPGTDGILLVREDDGWWMQRPHAVRAGEDTVDRLLRLLPRRATDSYALADMDTGEAGLEPPGRILRLDDVEARFGDTTPVGRHRYMAAGDRVYLVQDTSYMLLAGPPTDWVAKRLLPEHAEVVRLVAPGFTLERVDDGWERTPPRPEPVSGEDAGDGTAEPDPDRSVVDSWRRIRALRVAALEEEVPSDAPGVSIHLAGEDTPRRWWILPDDDRLRLADPDAGVVYVLADAQRETLGLDSDVDQD